MWLFIRLILFFYVFVLIFIALIYVLERIWPSINRKIQSNKNPILLWLAARRDKELDRMLSEVLERCSRKGIEFNRAISVAIPRLWFALMILFQDRGNCTRVLASANSNSGIILIYPKAFRAHFLGNQGNYKYFLLAHEVGHVFLKSLIPRSHGLQNFIEQPALHEDFSDFEEFVEYWGSEIQANNFAQFIMPEMDFSKYIKRHEKAILSRVHLLRR